LLAIATPQPATASLMLAAVAAGAETPSMFGGVKVTFIAPAWPRGWQDAVPLP